MNNTEFEIELYSLLLNHIDNKFEIDRYFKLLESEPFNSMLTYVLSHAYHCLNDAENAKKYLAKACELNSNIEFSEDYSNVFLVIYYIFSTITAKNNPYMEDEIEGIIKENSSADDYLECAQKYREINDISNANRVVDISLNKFKTDNRFKFEKASTLLYCRRLNYAWEYNEIRFDEIRKKLPQYVEKPKFYFQKKSAKVYIYPVTKLGDAIFFARYIKKIKSEYPLLKLFVLGCKPLSKLFLQNGIPIYKNIDKKNMDYQISYEGLPFLFREEEDYPYRNGYLKADDTLSAEYRERFFNNKKIKVGIVWNSSETVDSRNLELRHFERLFSDERFQFYSLQKETELSEQITLAKNGVVSLGEYFDDFTKTAAAVANLDCVIGCDTAVTNLAGAMGKATLLILPHNADWRWGLYEERSAWYDSVKLYRQKVDDNYDEVFSRLKLLLSNPTLPFKHSA